MLDPDLIADPVLVRTPELAVLLLMLLFEERTPDERDTEDVEDDLVVLFIVLRLPELATLLAFV